MVLTRLKLNTVICMRGAVLITLIWMVVVYRLRLESVSIEKTPGIIYMLQWTSSYTEPFAFMGMGVETFLKRKCSVMNCYITSNRELLGAITNFDVVLFHAKEIIEEKAITMPKKRTSNQKYVFASMESAGYYPVPPITFDGVFNLTWTYKLDSDIYFGYFVIRNRNSEIIGPSEQIQWISHKEMSPISKTIEHKIANKKIAAAWFVSNCRAPSKRHKLVEEIQRVMKDYGLSVDVYGQCGDKQCPRSSMKNCLKLLETDYYFYFSFENSFAEDYVTEKLLHALNHYTVPVVFGGANYKRFMPDGTYLDATQLAPQELVRQMLEIIRNPDRYNEFFKWHNHYSYHDIEEVPDTDPYCKLCEYINIIQLEHRSSVINDLEDWWNPHAAQWTTFYNTLADLLATSSACWKEHIFVPTYLALSVVLYYVYVYVYMIN